MKCGHPRVGTSKTICDYDVAILGGGSAGYAAARTVADSGLKTVVIEGGAAVGGLCILRGCMPTKALLYAAEVLHLASHPEPWGIRADDVSFNFPQVMARKNTLIRDFADYRRQQLASGGFKFLRALARFVDPHTLELSTGDRLTAATDPKNVYDFHSLTDLISEARALAERSGVDATIFAPVDVSSGEEGFERGRRRLAAGRMAIVQAYKIKEHFFELGR
jgi:hypothetical protein